MAVLLRGVKLISKCGYQSATRCSNSLHMHLGSSRVLTPLKMFCENMLTHVHKVIHLVVGTFEQGLGTSPADSPMVPPMPYKEKMEVTVSDQTLVSEGPARPVSRSSEDASVGL